MLTIQDKINEKFLLVQDKIDKHKFYIIDDGYVIGVRMIIGE